ncbi:MAG: phenylacetate--CoA ligase family protein [Firmicutes bacterium]|nr:phenylacetate--CoA ligase family protein [Bacillota bacterium]
MNFNKHFIEKMVYPLMEKKNGNKIREYLKKLKSTERYNKEKLKETQNEKLKKLLTHCIKNVPAYYEFRKYEELIIKNPYEALKKIPILNKENFMNNKDKYLSTNVDNNTLIPNKTGGSTGEPVKFFMDRYTVEHYEAARWRGLSWWDIDLGDRSVMIWGSPIELSKLEKFKFTLKEKLLKNRIIFSAYSLNPKNIESYVKKIKKYKPDYIYGYASSLYAFSKLMLENNISIDINLKGVVSTAETLHNYQRKTIIEAFNTRVINEYGAKDGGIIAYECPHGKMHIASENLIIEVVDLKTQKRLKEGNKGEILVTDLNNFSMPRLRYKLGDVGSLSNDKCECGVGLPILKNIEGREDEMFISKDGNLVHGHFCNQIARTLKGIKQFQLIQHDLNNATLKIVKNNNFENDEIIYFLSKITEVLGIKKENINVVYNKHIKPSSSGKLRYAIREFDIKATS